ncbi:hypothetical protein FBD94_09750 [Pedobacter hiemivivus]|uniref:Uncharacterized protein n=1 Tax=Pedobacter hiemivivus TaxID=2530454 RepID=A0A4U1GH51_9SPHI|nr:hypothetical protein [Pedobacter hiemivivus]TKC62489.1 hypothetical protein FBD94_09750 [Pedobacter hiemivivus]
MMANKPYWHKLLLYWMEKGHNGFTLPFLIGSQKYHLPDGNLHPQGISGLITEMALHSDTETYITYCPDIKQIIFGLRNIDKQKIAGEFFQLKGRNTQLFRTKVVNDLPIELDALIIELTDRFQTYVDNGQYSVNDLEWTSFTAKESDFIKVCFLEA